MFDQGATTVPVMTANPLRLHNANPSDYYDEPDIKVPFNVNSISLNNQYRII